MADSTQFKQFTELDFQAIKTSLKTHLKNQDELKDYNFEGSVINVILNMLAYNTQYNAYYMNMLASEKFISTAQKRESVVGAANNIGYIPYSRKSPSSYLSFTITPDAGYSSSITIPKDTKFTTTIDGTVYSYLTISDTVVIPTIDGYSVTDLEVQQGRKFIHKFTIGSTDKLLQLPNKGVDYNRIVVNVKQSSSSVNYMSYTRYMTLTELNASSQVYFIQEGSNGYTEIYFGDNILGKAISVGNEIIIEYYVTDGSASNGARDFTLSDEVTGLSSIAFTNIVPALNGSMEESIDSIRISAPTNYQAQNRAITELDYQVIIKKIYPIAKQISVIGGEKYTPKQYGKVFISIIKSDSSLLSLKDKNDIILELTTIYSGLTVIPVIVDPYIIRLLVDVVVKYETSNTNEPTVKTDVYNSISNFLHTEANQFKFTLRKSRFDALVDSSSKSILSNTSKLKLYIDTSDAIIPTKSNMILFGQEIKPKSLISSLFTYKNLENCQFIDIDGLGYASIYAKSILSEYQIIKLNVFSINYATGVLVYNDINYSLHQISVDNSSGIRIIIETLNDDIVISNNSVLYARDSDISISLLVE